MLKHWHFYWNAIEFVPKHVKNLHKEGHQLLFGQRFTFVDGPE